MREIFGAPLQRKLVWFGGAWLFGLFLCEIFQNKKALLVMLAVVCLLAAAVAVKRIPIRGAICATVAMALSVGTMAVYLAVAVQPVLAYDGETAHFSGKVQTAAVSSDTYARYQVKGKFADGTRATIYVIAEDIGAEYGDTLDVTGKFTSFSDSYLWSDAAYDRSRGIFLETEMGAEIECTPAEGFSITRGLQSYRTKIAQRITVFAGTGAGGMVEAMLLGIKTGMDDDAKDVLSQAGLSHVLSVSGLHLVLLLSIFSWLAGRIRLGYLKTFALTALITLLYALLVGTPISILRAGLMFLVTQAAPLFCRRADTLSSLCFAGVALTIVSPVSILDPSFLLSMAGTFGIAVFAPWITARMHPPKKIARLGKNLLQFFCVFLCTFPVTLYFYDNASILSPISNLILVPIASVMLVLSLIIFFTGGIAIVAQPIGFVLRCLYRLLMILANGLTSLVPITFPAGWDLLPDLLVVLICFVGLVFFLWRSRRNTAMAIAFSFMILLIGQTIYRATEKTDFYITILGSGTQEVVVISYHGKTDVIDLTGNHNNPGYVQKYLTQSGVRTIGTLCLTKYTAQMRVLYEQTLRNVSARETVVPEDAYTTPDMTLLSAPIQKADAYTIADPFYTIGVNDGTVTISLGTIKFYVTGKLREIPEIGGTVPTAIVCTGIAEGVDTENCPIYQKDEPLQIRVTPSGNWSVTRL